MPPVDFGLVFLRFAARINRIKRQRIYRAKKHMDSIMGKSASRNVYSEKSIGTTNRELLKVMDCQAERAADRAHRTPRIIKVLLEFFFIAVTSLRDIFITLYDKYITYPWKCQGKSEKYISLSALCTVAMMSASSCKK